MHPRSLRLFLSYLAAPVVGIPIDSGHIVDFVHSMPEWAKYTGKTILAIPFTFHSLNGLRHLTWDSTKRRSPFALHLHVTNPKSVLSNSAVTRSGYAVVAGTIVGTVALVLL